MRAAMKRYLQSKYGPNSRQLQKFSIAAVRTKGKKALLAIHGSPAAPAAPSGLPAAGGGTTK